MRIAVTGGTGFIGAHTVRAFLDAGHEVRLLVRTPSLVEDVLGPLGVGADDPRVEIVQGDVTDPAAVATLLEGADACFHCAGFVATNRAQEAAMRATNVEGTRLVLDAAVAAGCDPIVHVSSYSALFPTTSGVVGPDSPIASPSGLYGQTKAEAELHARALQDSGAPVVIVYPGGVIGPPAGPRRGEAAEGWQPLLASGISISTPGPLYIVDVRDLAAVHVAVMEPGRGPRRYSCGGTPVPFDEVVDILEEVTGKRIRRIPVPGAVLRGTGRLIDALAHVAPVPSVLSYDAALLITSGQPTDDSRTHEELGVTWRPGRETIAAAAAVDAERMAAAAPSNRRTVSSNGRVGRAVQRMATSSAFQRVGPKVAPRVDRAAHRVTGGRFTFSSLLLPIVQLTTTGRKSGQPRTSPLAALRRTDGWIVVGSNFAREAHPAWTANLLADPRAHVADGRDEADVEARLLEGAERDAVWPELLEIWPAYATYDERTARDLRVFHLRRV